MSENLDIVLKMMNENEIVVIQNVSKTVRDVRDALQKEIGLLKTFGRGLFSNSDKLPDGSYLGGIVLQGKKDAGIAVFDFRGKGENVKAKGKGENVTIQNVMIKKLIHKPIETVFIQFIDKDEGMKTTSLKSMGLLKDRLEGLCNTNLV